MGRRSGGEQVAGLIFHLSRGRFGKRLAAMVGPEWIMHAECVGLDRGRCFGGSSETTHGVGRCRHGVTLP
jgi:hypothetical protein